MVRGEGRLGVLLGGVVRCSIDGIIRRRRGGAHSSRRARARIGRVVVVGVLWKGDVGRERGEGSGETPLSLYRKI